VWALSLWNNFWTLPRLLPGSSCPCFLDVGYPGLGSVIGRHKIGRELRETCPYKCPKDVYYFMVLSFPFWYCWYSVILKVAKFNAWTCMRLNAGLLVSLSLSLLSIRSQTVESGFFLPPPPCPTQPPCCHIILLFMVHLALTARTAI
jgi:hypothetical protein